VISPFAYIKVPPFFAAFKAIFGAQCVFLFISECRYRTFASFPQHFRCVCKNRQTKQEQNAKVQWCEKIEKKKYCIFLNIRPQGAAKKKTTNEIIIRTKIRPTLWWLPPAKNALHVFLIMKCLFWAPQVKCIWMPQSSEWKSRDK